MGTQMDILTRQSVQTGWLITLAAGLSFVVAAVYFIIGTGLAPGDLQAPPAGLMLVAGAAYLVGGVVIFGRNRSLLALGAVLNPLVVGAYVVSLFLGNAEIEVLSLISKLAQFGLEVVLLMLLFSSYGVIRE